MSRRALALAFACGCGRLDFDPVLAIGPGDAIPDARCVPGAFSPPVVLPGPVQSLTDDWFPTPTANELELYYYQFVGTNNDAQIVRATRSSVSDPFSAPTQILDLSSGISDTSMSITEDGLDVVITRSGVDTHLFEASRSAAAAAFSAPTPIAEIAVSEDDLSPWLSPDGLRMVFASKRNQGGTIADLFETTRADRASPWQPPVALDVLNSSDQDDNPTLSADGLEIFFSSNRIASAQVVAIPYDVYTSRRPALDQPFEPPTRVDVLSGPGDDIGTRLSQDGLRLYFNYSTDRSGGANADIWMATRPCQ